MDNTLLSLKETAEYLKSSRAWLYKALSSKAKRSTLPPFLKIGSRYFFRKQDLDDWLSGQLNAPTNTDSKTQ